MDSFSSPSSGTSQNASTGDLIEQIKLHNAQAQAEELLETIRGKCFEKCITKPGSSLSGSEGSCISRCTDRYLEAMGGRHHRFKRGYKNVIDEAIRLNSVGVESHLAIETSGHGALKENHWLDDGAYLMVKLLNKLASAKASGIGQGSKVLTDMVDGLEEPGFAVELRLKIDQNHADLKGGTFREYGEAVLQHLGSITASDPKLAKAPVNYEGVRVSGYGGWFLLRLSLHDPVLPLNIEAPSHEEAVKLGLVVLSAVKEFQAIDTSALDRFLQV